MENDEKTRREKVHEHRVHDIPWVPERRRRTATIYPRRKAVYEHLSDHHQTLFPNKSEEEESRRIRGEEKRS